MSFLTSLETLVPVAGKGRAREDRNPWWEGRQVAVRPDVPGSTFDPGDLILIETDGERLDMGVRIDRSVAEEAETDDSDLWPAQWLDAQPDNEGQ